MNLFFPQGDTSNVAVTTSNQDVALNITGDTPKSLRVHIAGTETVFINIGGTASAATSMPLGPGHTEVFGLPVGVTSVGVIAGNTGSTAYFTVGNGV